MYARAHDPLVLAGRATVVFLSYLAYTLFLTYPLVRGLGSTLPSDVGDPVLNTWILWWNSEAVPLSERWWNAPMFHPMADVLTYSEHLLGLLPISGSVQWISENPILAYNIAWILSFPLAGLAAYWLCVELTGRRDVAWVAGLFFGFAPYRIDQLAHLQVLSSYWVPIVLLSLHRYLREGRTRWLVLLGTAYLFQSLCNLYLLLYLPVLVGLWVLWFVPSARWRVAVNLATTGAAAALLLLPILLRYRAAHDRFGFTRALADVVAQSADLTSLLSASPLLSLWGALQSVPRPEGQLFPGVTIVCLLAAAALRSRWTALGSQPVWLSRLRRGLAVAAGVVGLVLLVRFVVGPFEVALIGLTVTRLDKPFSVLLLCVTALALTSRSVVAASAERSALAFYTLAAVAMWVLAWGPFPEFRDQPVIFHAPYSWLMVLPGFDGVAVPARFWLLATACLAAAGGIALARLTPADGRARPAILALVACAALADGWISRMPVVEIPRRSPLLEANASGPLLELPLGNRDRDLAALYRSIYHGRPLVNGYSGYFPAHYPALEYSLTNREPEILPILSRLGIRDIVIHRHADGDGWYATYLSAFGAQPIASDADLALYRLPATRGEAPRRLGPPLLITGLAANINEGDLPNAVDGNRLTRWQTGPQQSGNQLTIDLGRPQPLGAVVLSLGHFTYDFPRVLHVEISPDGEAWIEVWRGSGAVETVAASMRDPYALPLEFPIGDRLARFVRLTQVADDPVDHWSISELSVHAPAAP